MCELISDQTFVNGIAMSFISIGISVVVVSLVSLLDTKLLTKPGTFDSSG